MADYLNEVGKWSRRLAILLLTITALVCWVLVFLIVVLAVDRPPKKPPEPLGPMIAIVAIFGGVGLMSVWMLARLLRGARARNGVTVLPLWFIEAFGFAFGAALCITAAVSGHPWLLTMSVPYLCAMILVRRRLAASEPRPLDEEVDNSADFADE